MKSRLRAKRCTSYASSSLNLDGDTAADRIQPRAANTSDNSSVRSEKCSLSDGFPPKSSAPAIHTMQMMCETCLLNDTHVSVMWQAAIFTCYFTAAFITSFFLIIMPTHMLTAWAECYHLVVQCCTMFNFFFANSTHLIENTMWCIQKKTHTHTHTHARTYIRFTNPTSVKWQLRMKQVKIKTSQKSEWHNKYIRHDTRITECSTVQYNLQQSDSNNSQIINI